MYNLNCCKEFDIEKAKLYSKIIWGIENNIDTKDLSKYLYSKYDCTEIPCSSTTIINCGINISQTNIVVACTTKPIINQIS
jgi:hypothetical protein